MHPLAEITLSAAALSDDPRGRRLDEHADAIADRQSRDLDAQLDRVLGISDDE